MASADERRGEEGSRRRRSPRKSSRRPGHDWAETDAAGRDSPPRRGPEHKSTQTPPPSSSHRSRRRTLSSTRAPPPSSRALLLPPTPEHDMPPLTRALEAVPYKRPGRELPWDYDDRHSREDGRRESSPRSTQRYRSTPDSHQSSRSYSSASGSETDATDSSDDEPVLRRPRNRLDLPRAPEPPRTDEPRRRRLEPRRSTKDEIVYEDRLVDENGRTYTYTVSQDDMKSFSKPSSSNVDEVQPLHRERRLRGPPSVETSASPAASKRSAPLRAEQEPSAGHAADGTKPRSSRRHQESDLVYVEKPPSLKRSHTTSGSHAASSHSGSSTRRSSTFLESFLGPAFQPQTPQRPVKFVECVVCMDDEVPSHKAAHLKCGHRMCNSCLKRNFKLSLTDPQNMPPKCCTSDHIPLKHVDRLFDNGFKRTWNRKYAEYSTRNRVYCPSRRCGHWIKPENMHREDGRKYAKCSNCKTKVCCLCNGKWHASKECPKDDETNSFLEQAKREGWQRCHKCKSMVELKEGCNHMTCRCGAEFCMICGSKWKTCDCPWFNYDTVENDRLHHMQPPMMPQRPAGPTGGGPPSPRDFRGGGGGGGPPGGPAAAVRPRPQNYEEELMLRRLQEQRDEELARRLQLQSFSEFDDGRDEPRGTGGFGGLRGGGGGGGGVGAGAGHFAGLWNPMAPLPPLPPDEYRRGTAAAATTPNVNQPMQQPPPPPPHYHATAAAAAHPHSSPFERANSGTDYVSGVSRARGVRASSLERRLADRFNNDLRQSPTHSHGSGFGPALRTTAAPGMPSSPALGSAPPPPPGGSAVAAAAGMPPMQMHMPVPPQVPMAGGPMAPRGPMAPMAPMAPMNMMGPLNPMAAMPMAPMPAPPMMPMMSRQPMIEEDMYSDPRYRHDYYDSDAAMQPQAPAPKHAQQQQQPSQQAQRRRNRREREREKERESDEPRMSVLAGLTGPGRGMNRVSEWRHHVEPGVPEADRSVQAS